jgi:hypothetical protein
LVEPELLKNKPSGLKTAIAVAKADPNSAIAKADDVGPAISSKVRDKSGVTVDAPALVEPELAKNKPGGLEAAIAIAEAHPHPVVAEANDVGAAVCGQIHYKARVFVNAPPGIEGKITGYKPSRLETAVAVAKTDPDPVIAKADDVRTTGTGHVADEARMFVHAPALIEPEFLKNQACLLKATIAIAEADPGPNVTEADDVGTTVAGQIHNKAGVICNPPSGVGFECDDGRCGFPKSLTIAIQARPNAIWTDPHYISAPVAI